MQSSAKQKPKVQEVNKPILQGSWHGQDARRMALKQFFAMLGITLVYLIGGMLLGFDSLIGRIFTSLVLVLVAAYYEYSQGMSVGETDAAFAEIMYVRKQEGKQIPQTELDRCYHPFKGFFAVLVGAIPVVLFALVFACITQPVVYKLGVLPSWTQGLMNQSEFGDALQYYNQTPGFQAIDILRIIDRAMIMPFVNVAAYISNDAALLAERLSPLLVLIAPMGFALGYKQGLKVRVRINTGIKMGDAKKKRRERKARKARQQSKAPERLI